MNAAILLSGGVGTRITSEIPKQYIPVAGRMIVTHALLQIYSHPMIDAVQVVAAEEWREKIAEELRTALGGKSDKPLRFSAPGETRQLSIYHGLSDLREFVSDDSLVLIHDAARPLVTQETITACLTACTHEDGAMPALPMKDTVYYSTDGARIERLLEREYIYAGQAPEAFRFASYLKANEALLPDRIREIRGSSEPAVLTGMKIAMIPGDEGNFKITTDADLEKYRRVLDK